MIEIPLPALTVKRARNNVYSNQLCKFFLLNRRLNENQIGNGSRSAQLGAHWMVKRKRIHRIFDLFY